MLRYARILELLVRCPHRQRAGTVEVEPRLRRDAGVSRMVRANE
jgi:hypothetical protein